MVACPNPSLQPPIPAGGTAFKSMASFKVEMALIWSAEISRVFMRSGSDQRLDRRRGKPQKPDSVWDS